MKHIKLLENFLTNEASTDRSKTDFTLGEFKKFFNEMYSYISHSETDTDLQKYLDEHKGEKLSRVADLYQDYLVSQGLADVQE